VRLLIVDDHEVVRDGVKRIFEDDPAAAFGEASNGEEAVRLLEQGDWDVVILDLSIGDRSGLDVLKEIKERRPRVPVLVLSMHTGEHYALRSFQLGASGYVTKGSSRSELRDAVHKVLRGGRYASDPIADKLLASLDQRINAYPHQLLSHREFEVLTLLAGGKSVGEIAEMLSLSDKTVSTYRSRVLQKLGLRTTPELIHYALQHGLLD
jgi:two-component system, NarL family, invasion response regulator UvrY